MDDSIRWIRQSKKWRSYGLFSTVTKLIRNQNSQSAGWNWIKDSDEIVVDTTLLVNLQRHLTSLHIMKYEKNICNVTTGHMVSELANCSIFSLVLGHDSYIHRSNRWEVVFQSSNRKLYKLLSILQGIWRIICSNKGKIMWGKNSHVPKFHSRLQNIL